MDPNLALRLSHTSEKLLTNDHSPSKVVPASPKKSRDNQLEPNDFFGEDEEIHEDRDGIPRAVSLDFDLNPSSKSSDNENFDPMLNIVYPSYATRVRLYLKPKDASVNLLTILLLIDTFLSLSYHLA